MRKTFILALLLTLTLPAFASYPVSGNLKDLATGNVSSGYVHFELVGCTTPPVRILGTATIPEPTFDFKADRSTGAIAGTIYGNNEIECNGATNNTKYRVSVFVNNRQMGKTKIYCIAGSFDLNSAIECTTTPPPAPNPYTYAYDSTVAHKTTNETIAGNKTFTGTTAVGDLNGCIWVDGIKYAQTNAGIQAAVNAASDGGCVYLPPATYALTASTNQQVLITKGINFVCAGWGANLQLDSSVGAIPILHFQASGAGIIGARVQDCRFSKVSGTPGSYAIEVESGSGPAQEFVKMQIDHNYIEQFGVGGIYLNNSIGQSDGGFKDSHIVDNYIFGGIRAVQIGDSVDVSNNLILGTPGWAASGYSFPALIDANFVPGAAKFRVHDNVLAIQANSTCAIHLGGGNGTSSSAAAMPEIEGNEIEPGSAITGGCNGAAIDIDGAAASKVVAPAILHNSFQIVNGSNLNALRLNYATNPVVGEGNNFAIGAAPAVGVEVTANSTYAAINGSNYWNGATKAPAVSDAGVGTTFGWGTTADQLVAWQDVYGDGYLMGPNGTIVFGGGTYTCVKDAADQCAGVASASPSAVPVSGTYFTARNLVAIDGLTPSTGSNPITLFQKSTVLSVDLASVAAGAISAVQTQTGFTGLLTSDVCFVTSAVAMEDGGELVCNVTAADTVKWYFKNNSAGPIDRASQNYVIRILR